MEVTLPPITELSLWILPALHAGTTMLFAGLFMKYARQAGEAETGKETEAHIARCVGSAIFASANLILTLVMSWHLFGKSLGLEGF